MSYILDALRRADTERGRGAVPGIHSQLDNPAAERAAAPRSRALLWAVIGLSAALVAVLAWVLLRGGEKPQPVVVQPPVAEVAVVAPTEVSPPVAAPQPTIVPTTPPPFPAEAPRAAVHMPTEAAPPSTRRAPPAESAPAAKTSVAPTTTAPAQTAKPAANPAPVAAATTSGASGASSRIYAVNELPDNIRSSLPQLSIGGAMYSPNKASRMLIVNGQLMHEGDKIAPDLLLDQIELKRAVLSFRGYRYSINY
jgi:general secretion pathway protein B